MHIWIYWYIIILHLGPFLNMLGKAPGGRVYGVTLVAHMITLVLALGTFARAREYFKGGFGLLDTLVSAYLGWSILSVVLFFQADHPSTFEAYLIGIHVCAAPILGYYAIKQLSPPQVEKVIRFTIGMNLMMLVFGLYCYYVRPDFYSLYLKETVFTRNTDMELWQLYARMQSYLGSTAVAMLSGVTLCLVVGFRLPRPVLLASVVLCVTSALLSRQRGGMGATAVALALVVWAGPWKKWVSIASIAVGMVMTLYVLTQFDEEHGIMGQVFDRFGDFDTTLAERRSGYEYGLDYLKDFPLGVGVGVTGAASEARVLSERGKVVDANYMRIAADLGVQGAALFIAILVTGITQSYGAGQIYLAAIIFSFSVVCTGTNIMDTHYVPHLFWMLMGLVKPPKSKVVSRERLDQGAPFDAVPEPVGLSSAQAAGSAQSS